MTKVKLVNLKVGQTYAVRKSSFKKRGWRGVFLHATSREERGYGFFITTDGLKMVHFFESEFNCVPYGQELVFCKDTVLEYLLKVSRLLSKRVGFSRETSDRLDMSDVLLNETITDFKRFCAEPEFLNIADLEEVKPSRLIQGLTYVVHHFSPADESGKGVDSRRELTYLGLATNYRTAKAFWYDLSGDEIVVLDAFPKQTKFYETDKEVALTSITADLFERARAEATTPVPVENVVDEQKSEPRFSRPDDLEVGQTYDVSNESDVLPQPFIRKKRRLVFLGWNSVEVEDDYVVQETGSKFPFWFDVVTHEFLDFDIYNPVLTFENLHWDLQTLDDIAKQLQQNSKKEDLYKSEARKLSFEQWLETTKSQEKSIREGFNPFKALYPIGLDLDVSTLWRAGKEDIKSISAVQDIWKKNPPIDFTIQIEPVDWKKLAAGLKDDLEKLKLFPEGTKLKDTQDVQFYKTTRKMLWFANNTVVTIPRLKKWFTDEAIESLIEYGFLILQK